MIFDLGGILSVDPVGTAQFRKLMQMLAAKTGTDEQVDRVHMLAVPAPFLERLGRPEDLTPKGQVLSLLIPYNCARCRATTQRLVDFVQHGEELRAGRVPRVKCGICGGPVTCVVSESWFSRLQTLPAPQVSPDLRATISRSDGGASSQCGSSRGPSDWLPSDGSGHAIWRDAFKPGLDGCPRRTTGDRCRAPWHDRCDLGRDGWPASDDESWRRPGPVWQHAGRARPACARPRPPA